MGIKHRKRWKNIEDYQLIKNFLVYATKLAKHMNPVAIINISKFSTEVFPSSLILLNTNQVISAPKIENRKIKQELKEILVWTGYNCYPEKSHTNENFCFMTLSVIYLKNQINTA